MRPFAEDDFPVRAIGNLVYRRLDSSPICTAIDDDMAQEIAKRMNQANQVYPEQDLFAVNYGGGWYAVTPTVKEACDHEVSERRGPNADKIVRVRLAVMGDADEQPT